MVQSKLIFFYTDRMKFTLEEIWEPEYEDLSHSKSRKLETGFCGALVQLVKDNIKGESSDEIHAKLVKIE